MTESTQQAAPQRRTLTALKQRARDRFFIHRLDSVFTSENPLQAEFATAPSIQRQNARAELKAEVDDLAEATDSEWGQLTSVLGFAVVSCTVVITTLLSVGSHLAGIFSRAWSPAPNNGFLDRLAGAARTTYDSIDTTVLLLGLAGLAGMVMFTVSVIRSIRTDLKLLDQAIEAYALPRLRESVNREIEKVSPNKLTIVRAPGLGHQLQGDRLISRAEADRVGTLLADLGATSIAISGSRGVGKTTLLDEVAASTYAEAALHVRVSAPSGYDARDFLIHLYRTLCQAVLLQLTGPRTVPAAVAGAGRIANWGCQSVGRLLAAAFAYLWFSTIFLDPDDAQTGVFGFFRRWSLRLTELLPISDLPDGAGLLLLAAGTAVASGLVARLLTFEPNDRAGRHLARLTTAQLRRLRYNQTSTSTWSGAVKRGIFDLGRSGSRQLAETPMTLPELVESFHQYVAAIGAWAHPGPNEPLVLVTIDEMDRIHDGVQADKFLNEIKGIFGVPGVICLVSVSEDALAAFESRIVRLRTTLDSTFDEVIRLEPFKLAQSLELLRRRITGLPARFAVLCHCVAGGIPRDLLRSTRTLLDEHNESGRVDLSSLASRLVAREVASLKRGLQGQTTLAADSVSPSEEDELWSFLISSSAETTTASELKQQSETIRSSDPKTQTATHLAAALLYYACVLELFDSPMTLVKAAVLQPDGSAAKLVDELTVVRALLQTTPELAATRLAQLDRKLTRAARAAEAAARFGS